MHWKAIFFDLDGTLVETAPEISDAVNDTLIHFDWPTVDQSDVDRWIGHGTQELLIQALAKVSRQSVDEVRQGELLLEALPIFDRHYQQRCGTRSFLYPYVRDTLERLSDLGCRLGLVTNKETRYTDTVLSAHEMTGVFDLVVCGDTFSTKKPDPVGVLHGLSLWRINKYDALFVGDSSIDASTARQAGIQVWLLPYGYNMGQPVTTCEPDRVITDISELL